MKAIFRYIFVFVFILLTNRSFAQERIGLVLSGGGATGLAHIGILKALEERGIPIDYVTGTSMGALVASFYAAGYSPEEIEKLALSESFYKMATGQVESYHRFSYRENDPNASMFRFGVGIDSSILNSIPTHYRSSTYVDYTLMQYLASAGEYAKNDFNQLFVPFRCVASDISSKKSVVFSKGKLNQAVRASMTYPFYFEPIIVNKKLLFDGGLYNNFPANIAYEDFNIDFIIGSNVAYNAPPPKKESVISQLTNMLVSHSDYNIPCDNGVLIEPKIHQTTFEFRHAASIIHEGYVQAQPYIDSILKHIERRVSKQEVEERRKMFRQHIQELRVSKIDAFSAKGKPMLFAKSSMIRSRNGEILAGKKFERRYFRLTATPQLASTFPLLDLLPDSTYRMEMQMNKAKDFQFEIGGHFSTRAVNTGFVGVSYNYLGRVAAQAYVNGYLGKFYSSVKTQVSVDVPSVFPVNFSAYFVLNKFDYFKSFATFFAPERPSFLVQNEVYTGIEFKHPIGNSTKSIFQSRYFFLDDKYFQNQNFSNIDTTDQTQFQGTIASWEFVQNNLNRKQFANSGHYASFKINYVYGSERSRSGSTAVIPFDESKNHSWLSLSADFQTYPLSLKVFHLGVHGTAVFNTQSLFSNYTASVLAMTAYAPLPDMKTYFMPEFRSPQYVGAGLNIVFTPWKYIDIRLDGYFYQPFRSIVLNDDGTFGYRKPFRGESYVASSSFIYHSPVGPVRATFNYFPKQIQPFAFQISFGYILFNQRAIR